MEDYSLSVCRDTHMTLEFVKAAELAAIPPGNMLRVQLRGQMILLANIEGRIFAIDDQCSHEDASLYNGALKGDCVECPLHGSRFRFATGYLGGPNLAGEDRRGSGIDWFFVSLAQNQKL
ncbi:MAG TPA: hypothetical protein ENK40_02870 [Gammaproteobacteria bacterium]|nr:hypothetical protein [Gammaproteobacteria bacterium]